MNPNGIKTVTGCLLVSTYKICQVIIILIKENLAALWIMSVATFLNAEDIV